MGQQMLKDVLKDEISQAMVKNNEVWLVECDEVKNYKFYFSAYNASTLAYLNKKSPSKSLFSWWLAKWSISLSTKINKKVIFFSYVYLTYLIKRIYLQEYFFKWENLINFPWSFNQKFLFVENISQNFF